MYEQNYDLVAKTNIPFSFSRGFPKKPVFKSDQQGDSALKRVRRIKSNSRKMSTNSTGKGTKTTVIKI